MNNDEKWMRLALEQAQLAYEQDEVPIGAVLVENETLLAASHNEKEQRQLATAHAEICVLNKASEIKKTWHLENTTLYVTLEPCIMCTGAILQSRVGRVVFGAYDPKGGAMGSNMKIWEIQNLNHYPIIEGGLLAEQSAALLKSFFKTKRNGIIKNRK